MRNKLWIILPVFPILFLIFLTAWLKPDAPQRAVSTKIGPAAVREQPAQAQPAQEQPVATLPEATPVPATPAPVPTPSAAPPLAAPAPTPWPKPAAVKGIYATAWVAGSSQSLARICDLIDQTELNALVIDVKDDTGTISYESRVPLADAIGSWEKKIGDPVKVLETLRQHQIFPIARIVVFKDPFLAKRKPEWAVKDSSGGLWVDRKGLHWVDPYNKAYWDYIVAIAREAISLGFQEIQFDYVRFTSDGPIERCVYPFSDGKLKQDVIRDFLQYAREQLQPSGIPVSADIFGLTTSVPDDQGIGQLYEKVIANVDVVSPMVYPSHYAPGSFGLGNPNLHPYETVLRAVSDARKRLEKAGNTTTSLRPWLQDFNLGAHYGRNEVQKQIQAVRDAGATEWIFWNPSCRYQLDKYR